MKCIAGILFLSMGLFNLESFQLVNAGCDSMNAEKKSGEKKTSCRKMETGCHQLEKCGAKKTKEKNTPDNAHSPVACLDCPACYSATLQEPFLAAIIFHTGSPVFSDLTVTPYDEYCVASWKPPDGLSFSA